MKKHIEKQIENDMETRIVSVFMGIRISKKFGVPGSSSLTPRETVRHQIIRAWTSKVSRLIVPNPQKQQIPPKP